MPIRKRYQLGPVDGARVGLLSNRLNMSFIVFRIGDTLIDAGPSNQWRAVRAFIDERPVGQLLLTHHHEDHSGNAARIAKHCALTPFAPPQSQDKLRAGYRTPIWQKIIWGSPRPVETQTLPDRIELGDGTTLRALHTPGHAKDLHCFHAPNIGGLFSGDLYLSRSIRMLRSDENLAHLIDSLNRVLALDFETIFCPHRGIVEGGKQALTEKCENIITLCAQAQDLHQQGTDVDQIVIQLLGPEEQMARTTRYNISKRNLITEALKVARN